MLYQFPFPGVIKHKVIVKWSRRELPVNHCPPESETGSLGETHTFFDLGTRVRHPVFYQLKETGAGQFAS